MSGHIAAKPASRVCRRRGSGSGTIVLSGIASSGLSVTSAPTAARCAGSGCSAANATAPSAAMIGPRSTGRCRTIGRRSSDRAKTACPKAESSRTRPLPNSDIEGLMRGGRVERPGTPATCATRAHRGTPERGTPERAACPGNGRRRSWHPAPKRPPIGPKVPPFDVGNDSSPRAINRSSCAARSDVRGVSPMRLQQTSRRCPMIRHGTDKTCATANETCEARSAGIAGNMRLCW